MWQKGRKHVAHGKLADVIDTDDEQAAVNRRVIEEVLADHATAG